MELCVPHLQGQLAKSPAPTREELWGEGRKLWHPGRGQQRVVGSLLAKAQCWHGPAARLKSVGTGIAGNLCVLEFTPACCPQVINIINAAQENSPVTVAEALDRVLEILRTTELYSPQLGTKDEDPHTSDLVGGLMTVSGGHTRRPLCRLPTGYTAAWLPASWVTCYSALCPRRVGCRPRAASQPDGLGQATGRVVTLRAANTTFLVPGRPETAVGERVRVHQE